MSIFLKQLVAEAVLSHIAPNSVIGVGTGSTVNCFIHALASQRSLIECAVSSSISTTEKLKQYGIPVVDIATVNDINVYIDGADLADKNNHLLKGAGGALTREKILATVAEKFICIADETKYTDSLSCDYVPISIEVIPMARGYVAREMVKLKGTPVYRQGFITDNGNQIIDVYHLDLGNVYQTEQNINNITGVVCHGLFAKRSADMLLLGTKTGIKIIGRA